MNYSKKLIHRFLLSVMVVISLQLNIAVANKQVTEQQDLKEQRIVGGTEAKAGDYPWMVALVSQSSSAFRGQFCGASLISPDWVLTAAHCVNDQRLNSPSIDVVINQNDLTENNGERIAVKKIVIHPSYNSFTDNNDIALLQLSSSANNPTVSLPESNMPELDNMMATILGWGLMQENTSKYPELLNEANVPIISNDLCNTYDLGQITAQMLCAGYEEGGIDACQGDSGGPLVVSQNGEWIQVGITSWGIGCARAESFGVYTRISQFNDWISQTMTEDDEPDQTLYNVDIMKNCLQNIPKINGTIVGQAYTCNKQYTCINITGGKIKTMAMENKPDTDLLFLKVNNRWKRKDLKSLNYCQ